VADEAVATTRSPFGLVATDRARVLDVPTTSVSAARLSELLPEHPTLTVARTVELLGATKPTAAELERAGP
jgi:hypothetical protein